MKLNKPKVTDNQSELESYVESLLKDNVELVPTADGKVTPLRSKKVLAQELQSSNISVDSRSLEPSAKDQVADGLSVESRVSHNEVIQSFSETSSKPSVDLETTKPDESITEIIESTQSAQKTKQNDKVEQFLPSHSEPVDSVKQPDQPDQSEGLTQTSSQTVKPVDKQTESPEVSIKTESTENPKRPDSAQQHHEKIAKEFRAYQESAHTNIPDPDPRLKNVEKLLSRIALASAVVPNQESQTQVVAESATDSLAKPGSHNQDSQAVTAEVAEASFLHRDAKPMKELLGDIFQTLVFEVHKLPLAVPLVKLGGIVNFTEQDITPLVGTPEWFLGLVPNERGNLMVVDTQKFLMPEKVPSQPVEYQYLIVLDNSNWALACHAVNDAKNLSPDDIRWSARSSKRPWFAGMVVEYMSALMEVDELINMLAENVVE